MKNRIQQIMEIELLNPAAFAKRIEINPSALSHILNGRNKPSLDMVQKILQKYPAINPDWLLTGSGTMQRKDMLPVSPLLFDELQETPKQQPIVEVKTVELPPQSAPAAIKPIEVLPPIPPAPDRKIERIIVYYTNNVFEEFLTK